MPDGETWSRDAPRGCTACGARVQTSQWNALRGTTRNPGFSLRLFEASQTQTGKAMTQIRGFCSSCLSSDGSSEMFSETALGVRGQKAGSLCVRHGAVSL